MEFNINDAIEFLGWIDDFTDDFTFQTFDDDRDRKKASLVDVLNGSMTEHQKRLRDLNNGGAGIYVTVNETDLTGRSKDHIVAPRAIFLDDDGGVIEPPIKPNIIVHTSANKRHLYYLIDDREWGLKEYERALKQFAAKYGGDLNAREVTRVLRVPGFYNMKDRDNPYLVHAELIDLTPKTKDEILNIIDFENSEVIETLVQREYTENDLETVKEALEYIPSDDRETWIRFGIALKNDFGDDGFEVWDKWSQESSKYTQGECEEKWKGFKGDGDIHIASIIYEAKKHGFITSLISEALPPEEDFDSWNGEPFKSSLRLLKASDFEGKEVPEQNFIFDGLVIAGAPVSLYGNPGVGKSTLALQMCASVALGQDFMGFKTNQSKCLMLSCEDDTDEIHRRLDRMCRAYDWQYKHFENNLVFCCRAGEDNLLVEHVSQGKTSTKTGFFSSIIETIKSEKFDFVVIDNIANVFGGNENDRSETTRFMTAIYALCEKADISVLLLGHPPKSQANYSGSTAWEATVRQLFTLERDKDIYLLKCEKANYLRDGEEIEMAKNADGIFVEPFSIDAGEDRFDFEGLKIKIWSFVKECNDNNVSISFAHQAGADYYGKKLVYKGFAKSNRIKDIHRAVEELASEGKLTKKAGTSKMMAVECV